MDREFVMIGLHQSPTFSFEYVPITRPYPPASTYAHPCYSNCARVFKSCVMCITRLYQVLVGLDKWKVVHCRWLQPKTFFNWRIPCIQKLWLRFGVGCKDAQNRCPPMNNNIAPMPTQNPWAWEVWAPNAKLWFACNPIRHNVSIVNMVKLKRLSTWNIKK